MKKYLALIVAIAMVLSLAVTAFVFTTSANASVDVDAVWEASTKATYVQLVEATGYALQHKLNDGETVNFAETSVEPYAAGTMSLSNGVLTISGLEYDAESTMLPAIHARAGIKIIIDGCEYKGNLRNDWSDDGGAGALVIEGKNGASWTSSATTNVIRGFTGIYVYGDLAVDIVPTNGVQIDAAGDFYFAPERPSTISGANDGLFNGGGGGSYNNIILAGGSDITFEIGQSGNATTFSKAVTNFVVDNANVEFVGKFAEWSGTIENLPDSVVLKNGATLDVEAFYGEEGTPAEAVQAKFDEGLEVLDESVYYVAGELVEAGPDYGATELTGWNAYAEEKWDAVVAAGAAATKVELRADRYGYCKDADGNVDFIENGETVDFATNPAAYAAFPYSAGTMTLVDGVLTLSDLVRKDGDETFAVIIGYGSLKVVIDGEYDGCIRNDEGTAGPLFVTGGENGGFWTCPANNDDMDVNNFRTRNGLYVYGNIGFDLIGVFQFDTAVGEVVLCPAEDSRIEAVSGKELFMNKNGNYANKLVVAGGATVTIDDATATTFPTGIAVTDIIVDGAEVVWEDEFAECGGDNYDLLPAITLSNGAKFTAASVYPGSQTALVEKVTCDATSTFEILDTDDGEGDEGEGDEDADLDFGDIDVSTLTGWAKYAEDKWAAVTNKAPAVSIVGHGTGAPVIATLTNENNVVDLAGKDPFKAGIATFKDGVLTLTGLEYMEETTVHAEIRGMSGAIKVVINGCTFDGHVRNDYTYNGVAYGGMEDAAVFVTSKNGGKLACDCLAFGESYYDNAIRSGHSIYVYNVQVDLDRDGFVSEGSAEEVIFAPGVDSTIDITSAYGMFGKTGVTKVVFAGEGAIDVAIGEGFPVFNGNMFVEWIIDGADVTFAGLVKGSTSTVEFTVKNGAVLDIEALDEALTVEVTCEDTAAYYLGGELIKEGSGASGEEGGEEGGEGEEKDPTGFVPNANKTWAEYAEAKWAKENTAASYVVLGYIWSGTVTPENNITLDAENPTIDFAETSFGCYKAGTMTFANGVLTVKDLEYNEGHASSCNDGMIIAMGGAVKVVLDGCDFVGTIRNDWGAAASLYVQGVNGATWNTGIINAEGVIGEDKTTDNLMRSEASMYVYGDLTLNVNAGNDALVRLTGAAGTEAVIAPEGGANITIAATKPIVVNKTEGASVARFVFGGGNVIKLNLLGANYTVGPDATTLGEFILDATKLEVTGKFGVAATDVKYVLKNGAVLAVDEIFKNAKITVEHGAYYLAGALVEANAPAGGEGGDNGNTSAALIAPFIVMIALTSVAAVMIVRKKRA